MQKEGKSKRTQKNHMRIRIKCFFQTAQVTPAKRISVYIDFESLYHLYHK